MTSFLRVTASLAALTLFFPLSACGDDGDPGGGGADAMVQQTIDASTPQPDAMGDTTITMGLGKTCNAPADCAPPTQGCLGPAGAAGICSGICKDDYMVTTDASGGVPLPDAADASHATCAAMFSGSVGVPVCAIITAATPADNPLMANTAYSLQLACALAADNGACPANLTADAQGFCQP